MSRECGLRRAQLGLGGVPMSAPCIIWLNFMRLAHGHLCVQKRRARAWERREASRVLMRHGVMGAKRQAHTSVEVLLIARSMPALLARGAVARRRSIALRMRKRGPRYDSLSVKQRTRTSNRCLCLIWGSPSDPPRPDPNPAGA